MNLDTWIIDAHVRTLVISTKSQQTDINHHVKTEAATH